MKIWVSIVLLIAIGVGIYLYCQPREFLGSDTVYNTITLQIGENTFYDVRVPVEAKLLRTDGMTVYEYDIITVGVQDLEPTTFCKVKVGERWVFANSPDNWYKATIGGFETEEPYEGTFDVESTRWTDTVPPLVMDLDRTMLESLQSGASIPLGGKEFVTSQVTYGVFDAIVDKALTRMSTLYLQPIKYGMRTEKALWVVSGEYTVAVRPINYNTCMLVTACGDTGRQYAIALMEGVYEEG